MKLDTIMSGWSIVYIEVTGATNILFLSLPINFFLANSADPNEMPHYAVFYLGLHGLRKDSFWGFWSTKG